VSYLPPLSLLTPHIFHTYIYCRSNIKARLQVVIKSVKEHEVLNDPSVALLAEGVELEEGDTARQIKHYRQLLDEKSKIIESLTQSLADIRQSMGGNSSVYGEDRSGVAFLTKMSQVKEKLLQMKEQQLFDTTSKLQEVCRGQRQN
jgi:hypothetical protein